MYIIENSESSHCSCCLIVSIPNGLPFFCAVKSVEIAEFHPGLSPTARTKETEVTNQKRGPE